MNCTGIPSVCVSPMWPNIMNINDCNTWQLSATRYGIRVRWLFPCLHGIEKVVIWFTEDIIRLAFATSLIYLGIWLCKIPVVVTPIQITRMNYRYCYYAKLDTRVIFFQSIAPPTKRSRAWFIQIDQWLLHLKMATRLVFAGRWTEKRHHSTFVCLSTIK